jgi:dihydroxyacetone kinase-like predicted kinase
VSGTADTSALLARVRAVTAGAAAALGAARQRIDDMNVYPVPDGDTGTNLAQTVARVVSALEAAEPAAPERLAFVVRDAALRGAKGNSPAPSAARATSPIAACASRSRARS